MLSLPLLEDSSSSSRRKFYFQFTANTVSWEEEEQEKQQLELEISGHPSSCKLAQDEYQELDDMASPALLIVKYVLLIFTIVGLLCAIPAIPVGLRAIGDLELHETHEKSLTHEQANSERIILIVLLIVEMIALLFTFIGGLKENFCLSMVSSILLLLWSLGYMFIVRSGLDIILLVMNVMTSIVGIIFSALLKSDRNMNAAASN